MKMNKNRILATSVMGILWAQAFSAAAQTTFQNAVTPVTPPNTPPEAEASAVVPVGAAGRYYVVASNETPYLELRDTRNQIFPGGTLTQPISRSGSYIAPVGNTGNNSNRNANIAVNDLECSTVFATGAPAQRYYVFMGSCGRNSSGQVRLQRNVLFAIGMNEAVDPPAFQAGNPSINQSIRNQLFAYADNASLRNPNPPAWGAIVRNSIRAAANSDDVNRPVANPALAPESAGLNIEGLTVSADGTQLLAGLRNPLVGGNALLFPITNPLGALAIGTAQQAVQFADPVLLNLGGRGIRSIEWVAARNRYVISAGPVANVGTFALFEWHPTLQPAPLEITTPSAIVATSTGLTPEGITPFPGRSDLMVVSDDNGNGNSTYRGTWVEWTAPAVSVSIAATDATASEPASGTDVQDGMFQITRTGDTTAPLTVFYSVDGTASPATGVAAAPWPANTDFTVGNIDASFNGNIVIPAGQSQVNLPVTIINDTLCEDNKTIRVQIRADDTYSRSAAARMATVTLQEVPGVLVSVQSTGFSGADDIAEEPTNSYSSPPSDGKVRFFRAGFTTGALTIPYAVVQGQPDDATPAAALSPGNYYYPAGSDYTLPGLTAQMTGTITFAAGESYKDLPVTVIDDALYEANETIRIVIPGGCTETYAVNAGAASATVTLKSVFEIAPVNTSDTDSTAEAITDPIYYYTGTQLVGNSSLPAAWNGSHGFARSATTLFGSNESGNNAWVELADVYAGGYYNWIAGDRYGTGNPGDVGWFGFLRIPSGTGSSQGTRNNVRAAGSTQDHLTGIRPGPSKTGLFYPYPGNTYTSSATYQTALAAGYSQIGTYNHMIYWTSIHDGALAYGQYPIIGATDTYVDLGAMFWGGGHSLAYDMTVGATCGYAIANASFGVTKKDAVAVQQTTTNQAGWVNFRLMPPNTSTPVGDSIGMSIAGDTNGSRSAVGFIDEQSTYSPPFTMTRKATRWPIPDLSYSYYTLGVYMATGGYSQTEARGIDSTKTRMAGLGFSDWEARDEFDSHSALVWTSTGTTVTDISQLGINSGWAVLNEAANINSAGMVVGTGTRNDGTKRGFLVRP